MRLITIAWIFIRVSHVCSLFAKNTSVITVNRFAAVKSQGFGYA